MGTRGFITFVIDGEEKTTYNHSDSYPDGLGVDVLSFARGDMLAAAERARSLQLIDPESLPTEEQKAALRPFANLAVGTRSMDDWYCLLRETQGNPAQILAAGYMTDARDFPADSLFAEYGYVVDFDAQRFEAYRGFQEQPHDKGRFASRKPKALNVGTYYPVALVESWPLDALPTDEAFCAAIYGPDSEDAR